MKGGLAAMQALLAIYDGEQVPTQYGAAVALGQSVGADTHGMDGVIANSYLPERWAHDR